MTAPRRLLALLLLGPALALGACGSDSDADQIEGVIQDVAKDAAAICDHATDKLLDSLGGGGAEGCKESARAYPDDSTEGIKGDIDVKVDGDRATADFTDNEDEKQHVIFVKQDGHWLVDAVE